MGSQGTFSLPLLLRPISFVRSIFPRSWLLTIWKNIPFYVFFSLCFLFVLSFSWSLYCFTQCLCRSLFLLFILTFLIWMIFLTLFLHLISLSTKLSSFPYILSVFVFLSLFFNFSFFPSYVTYFSFFLQLLDDRVSRERRWNQFRALLLLLLLCRRSFLYERTHERGQRGNCERGKYFTWYFVHKRKTRRTNERYQKLEKTFFFPSLNQNF